MTKNSQLSTTEPKTKTETKQTKQTTRTGTESQKWRSQGGLSVGEWEGEKGGKGTENKQHKWQVQNRQEEVKNIVNTKAKELISMTHGHELRQGNAGGRGVSGQRGIKGRKKRDNCNSIINKYIKNKIKNVLCSDKRNKIVKGGSRVHAKPMVMLINEINLYLEGRDINHLRNFIFILFK